MSRPGIALLSLLLLPCSCGFWGKEYVLYDGKAEREAAEKAQAEQQVVEGEQQVVEGEQAVEGPPVSAEDLERIFALEATLDELDRAIRDGLDADGSLARKRAEVADDLARRKAAAGPAYEQARKERLQRWKY